MTSCDDYYPHGSVFKPEGRSGFHMSFLSVPKERYQYNYFDHNFKSTFITPPGIIMDIKTYRKTDNVFDDIMELHVTFDVDCSNLLSKSSQSMLNMKPGDDANIKFKESIRKMCSQFYHGTMLGSDEMPKDTRIFLRNQNGVDIIIFRTNRWDCTLSTKKGIEIEKEKLSSTSKTREEMHSKMIESGVWHDNLGMKFSGARDKYKTLEFGDVVLLNFSIQAIVNCIQSVRFLFFNCNSNLSFVLKKN